MAEAYEALTSLRKVLTAKREHHKEQLAHGHSEADLVGRCKGLEWAIDRVNEQIKSLTQGNEDVEPESKN
jgi:hypothetical protein